MEGGGRGRWRSRGRRRSDITAASWVRAANSVITWSHTEGAGRRSCENKHMEAMQEAKPRFSISASHRGAIITAARERSYGGREIKV